MKKGLLLKSFRFLMIGALLMGASAQAVVNWHGGAIPGDVTDQDIDVQGVNTISGPVTVTATTSDVAVTISTSSAIRGIASNPRFFLVANAGRKIAFNVDNNLLFSGDDTTKLLITVEGPGTVEFVLADGKKVSFTSDAPEHGGTRLFVHATHDGSVVVEPKLRFSRATGAANSEVVVGPKSIMSYIAGPAVGTTGGSIRFDPANTGAGRMVLRIDDGGAVYVSSSEVTPTGALPALYLSDIDMTTNKGRAAFITTNSIGTTATAGLLVINENTQFPDLRSDPWREGTAFTGQIWGFVLTDVLVIGENSYIDYVGLTNNFCPNPTIPEEVLAGRSVGQVVKPRNASALIVDSGGSEAVAPTIVLSETSALFFRSGVDRDGSVSGPAFLVDPMLRSFGEGNIVFAVETPLNVQGHESGNSKIEVLSLEVAPTGAPVLIEGAEDKFPLRTFGKDGSGDYLQYNAACMLINSRVELLNTNIVHTDEIHKVFEKDDVRSEPTYIGGETFVITHPPTKAADIENAEDVLPARPKIVFYNSMFRIHTSVALTGVDLAVPNAGGSLANNSIFRFYHNGSAYRDGSGRQMILGTQIGAFTCDPCCSTLSRDAHLDVIQDVNQTYLFFGPAQELILDTAANDDTIVEGLTEPVGGEIHTIYLGHASNISIGSPGDTFTPAYDDNDDPYPVTMRPILKIEGNFFSFETRGGPESCPESSAMTGRGGIFVDTNGRLSIAPHPFTPDTRSLPGYRANMSAMVVKSGNGWVNLPTKQVFFDNRVGIANWKLDLTDAAQRIIVAEDAILSDYTLNWRDITKDYDNFTPFEVSDMLTAVCVCPGVTEENVTSLPTVEGLVEQLQIKGSRLGAAAHLMVDDGWVRELVFLHGCDSADAPVAVVVLKNGGRVGLGSEHRNRDSLSASVVLGVNGVTIIADGDGRVDLNEDIIVNNVCHILRGPNFDPDGEEVEFNKLQFHSDCERCLIVKTGGVLDLSSFTESNHYVEFAGNVKLLLEPGSTVIMGGGVLRVVDHARIETAAVSDISTFDFGEVPTIASTDPLRVRFIGEGTVQLDEDAVFQVGDDSYVGVETFFPEECMSHPMYGTTDLYFDLRGRSKLKIGTGSGTNSSVFQIGNTTPVSVDKSQAATINFRLAMNGVDSECLITSRGFLGLAVGMAQNTQFRPTDWLVDTLFNVESISIEVPEGTFRHDRIFNSDDPFASLLAIGVTTEAPIFSFDYISPITADTTQATILGGGNMALVAASENTALNPTVQEVDGEINSRLTVGLFSSKAVLEDPNHIAQPANPMTATQLFTFWKTADIFPFATMFINASEDEHNLVSVGYADAVSIVRGLISQIVGQGGIPVARTDFEHTFNKGSLFADLGFGAGPRPVGAAFELP